MGRVQLRELEERGHYFSVPRGVSMLPLLRDGEDIVEVRRLDRTARRGELVLYVRGDQEQGVLHRVIRVRAHDYVIAGDNCWRYELVSRKRVVGVAASFCRNGRWYDVGDASYRLYAWVWTGLYPLRRLVFYARDRVNGIIGGWRVLHA